jgi:DNA-binding response OmpR family regulator
VRAQLRQHQARAGQYLSFSDLQLDPQAKTLTKAEQPINLTAKEFQILHKLMLKPDHIVTREQLEESLYAWGTKLKVMQLRFLYIRFVKKLVGTISKPFVV